MDAFLVHRETLYRPQIPETLLAFMTPVTALIEGIWKEFPGQARAILRSRIFANYPLTPACVGMVKVAAKRISVLPDFDFQAELTHPHNYTRDCLVTPDCHTPFDSHDYLGRRLDETDAIALLCKLRTSGLARSDRFLSDRGVSALLLDQDGVVLSYAWNCNGMVKIKHAEHELVWSWLLRAQRKIPKFSTLYTSLKPCAMCAGTIFGTCDDFSTIRICFLDDDPGPMAANSLLIKDTQLWRHAGQASIVLEQIRST